VLCAPSQSWPSLKSLSHSPSLPPPQMLAQSQVAIGISSVRGPSSTPRGPSHKSGSSRLLFCSWAPPFRKTWGKNEWYCVHKCLDLSFTITPPPLHRFCSLVHLWRCSWVLHVVGLVGPPHHDVVTVGFSWVLSTGVKQETKIWTVLF